jgi:hypothetical protein
LIAFESNLSPISSAEAARGWRGGGQGRVKVVQGFRR